MAVEGGNGGRGVVQGLIPTPLPLLNVINEASGRTLALRNAFNFLRSQIDSRQLDGNNMQKSSYSFLLECQGNTERAVKASI